MDGFSEPVCSHGSWEYELGDRSLRWSDGLYRIHGVARGGFELTPDRARELIHPEAFPPAHRGAAWEPL